MISKVTYIISLYKRTVKSISLNTSILLLDDEFDITAIFKQGLDKRGFEVFGFTDPLLALEHFQVNSKEYGLVISDLRMPRMNGYEFIRVKEIKPEIKVFLMTAFEINDAEFERLLLKINIEGIMQKPFTLADLTSTVSKY
jgi:DNA-binding NtrC family response regulator